MFGEIGIEKILFLLIIVLLLFGAKKIPEIGSSSGWGIREVQAQRQRVATRDERAAPVLAHSASASGLSWGRPATSPRRPTRPIRPGPRDRTMRDRSPSAY